MTREQDERLTKLRESGVEIYSISRLGTINNCLAEAYKTYVLKERGGQNIYAALGGKIHDVLEGIVNDKNTEADLLPAMYSELDDLDMLGIEFPKDFKGEDSIREGWIADMKHFCDTYKSPRGNNLHTEELFIYKTPKGRYLQGFIDLYKENNDGSISIYDYKTSSMYTGEAIREHGYQLLTYALGKMQEGYNVKSVAWIMLKYVDIEFMGYKTAKSKEKTLIKKTVERRKIASEMVKYIENDLYNAGIDETEADIIITEFKLQNDFNCIPENIRSNYKIKPCVFEYEITEESLNDCIDYIETTIDKWESLDKTNELEFKPRSFVKTNKKGETKPDYFFCSSLCSHFKSCKYIHDYLDTLQDESNDEDLF